MLVCDLALKPEPASLVTRVCRADTAQVQAGNREGHSKGALKCPLFFFRIYLQAMSKKAPYVFLPSELTREVV